MRTEAADFDNLAVDGEAAFGHGLGQRASEGCAFQLGGGAAGAADEKLRGMMPFTAFRIQMRATDEGVEARQTMNKSVLHQEFQRAINGHGRGASAVGIELRQDVVSAHRHVTLPNNLQHIAANVRQTHLARSANGLSLAQGGRTAAAVIMIGFGKGSGFGHVCGLVYVITSHYSLIPTEARSLPDGFQVSSMRALALYLLTFLTWTIPAWAAPRAVASIKPVHALLAGVMEGVAAPDVLLKGSASAHAYTLRPSDAESLNKADVVFWIGPSFEVFLQKPLAALAGKARIVTLMDTAGVKVLPAREGGLHQDAETPSSSSYADGHLWLDPRNAKALVEDMVVVLSALDSSNAGRYRTNGDLLQAKLNALDRRLQGQLALVADRRFVVFHDAYQYFERRYGLRDAAALTVGPDRAPGAQRIAAIEKDMRTHGASCIFAEPQFEPKLVRTLADALHARVGQLDPEGSTLAAGPELYFNLMQGLADHLVSCLSAS